MYPGQSERRRRTNHWKRRLFSQNTICKSMINSFDIMARNTMNRTACSILVQGLTFLYKSRVSAALFFWKRIHGGVQQQPGLEKREPLM
jgi:hypothetical protein